MSRSSHRGVVVLTGVAAAVSGIVLATGAQPQAQLIPLFGGLLVAFLGAAGTYAIRKDDAADREAETERALVEGFLTALDTVRSTTIAVQRNRNEMTVEAAEKARAALRNAATALETRARRSDDLLAAAQRARRAFDNDDYEDARQHLLEVSGLAPGRSDRR